MIYLTADLHFGHKNIIEHAHRPWKNVDEMNEGLIENWNKLVHQDDEVYVLGDLSWVSRAKTVPLIYRLKGRIYLIRGNHDNDVLKKDCVERFEWVKDYFYLKVQDPDGPDGKTQPIILFHYPILSFNHINYGAWHCHGHCHGSLPVDMNVKRLDVGVDALEANYSPISYARIKEMMKHRKFIPVDHHEELKGR